jgi:hypothetical protein
MTDDLVQDTEVRRNNAYACLAGIVDRLPVDQADRLIASLARQLADSDGLRWRLGIAKIQNVLTRASPDDQQGVAGKLIGDLLRSDGDTPFRLESSQTPSLDEAARMAKQACDLVLEIRSNHGLPQQDDDLLLGWLEVRRIAIGGKEYIFPFSQLEEWMAGHATHLVPALRERYTEMVINELEGTNENDDD